MPSQALTNNPPKFAIYLSFPIGWMYYFGTNLDSRFHVPDFWPSQEQSHRIPKEKSEIRAEVQRIQREVRERRELREGRVRAEGVAGGGGGGGGGAGEGAGGGGGGG